MTHFAALLLNARRRMKKSQQEIADSFDPPLSDSFITRCEKGRSIPDVARSGEWSRVLGVSMEAVRDAILIDKYGIEIIMAGDRPAWHIEGVTDEEASEVEAVAGRLGVAPHEVVRMAVRDFVRRNR